ncbi:MAG TPA: RtcB family protein [Microvirga sp.]|jgi:tRNA-splicing ligase RtcB|nr:RtcB family protein [Microvirga sp.]
MAELKVHGVHDGHRTQNGVPGLKVHGVHDENTLRQMHTCMEVGSVHQGVLCADGHYGYAQPVGGVIAYESHISISGVGFDIGCGNLAAKLDVTYDEIRSRIPKLGRDIARRVSFGLGRTNKKPVDHPLFDSPLWQEAGTAHLKSMAAKQLGTVGSGNHYVDLFRDEDDWIWVGLHFGSRGLGHKTATQFLKAAGGRDGMDVPPALVEADSELGRRYIAGMTLAGDYAYAGREWVVEEVRRMLGAGIVDTVHNHHNYAWRERHGERDYWVVRKGATPAFPGQRGFVGGSMGDDAVILEGIDSDESRTSLYSTVHGAGRVMGRKAAKRTLSRDEMQRWLRGKEVFLVGGDLDEAPMAYRRLDEVLSHHEGTIRVLHRLRPILVIMAGSDVRDPYKD